MLISTAPRLGAISTDWYTKLFFGVTENTWLMSWFLTVTLTEVSLEYVNLPNSARACNATTVSYNIFCIIVLDI
jgi:hypothetical protein